eukprot:jgi/Psemu1/11266/gm1.11266_g
MDTTVNNFIVRFFTSLTFCYLVVPVPSLTVNIDSCHKVPAAISCNLLDDALWSTTTTTTTVNTTALNLECHVLESSDSDSVTATATATATDTVVCRALLHVLVAHPSKQIKTKQNKKAVSNVKKKEAESNFLCETKARVVWRRAMSNSHWELGTAFDLFFRCLCWKVQDEHQGGIGYDEKKENRSAIIIVSSHILRVSHLDNISFRVHSTYK